MKRKTFTARPELKADGPAGTIIARFATLNVIDSDLDVTLPGAFGDQGVRVQPSGHDTRAPTIGKGRIREEGDDAILEAQLNLNMQAGKEHYESLKFDMENGEPLQEWSYIFDVEDSELGQHEGQDVRFLKKMRVYSVDPVFLGAGVGTGTVAVKDRAGLTFSDHAEHVLDDVQVFTARSRELAELRGKDGRTLSEKSRERLTELLAALQDTTAQLDALLKQTTPPPPAPAAAPGNYELLRLTAELEQTRHDMAALTA